MRFESKNTRRSLADKTGVMVSPRRVKDMSGGDSLQQLTCSNEEKFCFS